MKERERGKKVKERGIYRMKERERKKEEER